MHSRCISGAAHPPAGGDHRSLGGFMYSSNKIHPRGFQVLQIILYAFKGSFQVYSALQKLPAALQGARCPPASPPARRLPTRLPTCEPAEKLLSAHFLGLFRRFIMASLWAAKQLDIPGQFPYLVSECCFLAAPISKEGHSSRRQMLTEHTCQRDSFNWPCAFSVYTAKGKGM